MLRRIDAPGIQINEIDRSQYGMPDYSIVGTTCLICGFADRGDNYTIKWINTIQTLIDNYGYPYTEEERYFWNACVEVLNKGGICLAARLPYDNNALTSFPYVDYSIRRNKRIANTELREFMQLDVSLSSYTEIKQTDAGYMSDESYDRCILNSGNIQQDTIRIVDITNSQYQEANVYDENDAINKYECIGLLPIVVAPANAMFYQRILDSAKNTSSRKIIRYFNTLESTVQKLNNLLTEVGEDGNKYYVIDSQCYKTIHGETTAELTALRTADGSIALSNLIKPTDYYTPNGTKFGADYKNINNLSSIFDLATTDPDENDGYSLIYVGDSINRKFGVAQNYLSAYETNEYEEQTDGIQTYQIVDRLRALNFNAAIDLPFNANSFAQQLTSNTINDYTLAKQAASILPDYAIIDDAVAYKDTLKQIGIAVFKVMVDESGSQKLRFQLVESYVGSLDRNAKDSNGSSLFIDNIVNNTSKNIKVFSNKRQNSLNYNSVVDDGVLYYVAPRHATILGQSKSRCEKNIDLKKSISNALNLIYDKAKDKNRYYIDLVVDAGVSNIAQACNSAEKDVKKLRLESKPYVEMSILQKYDTFCKNMRGDCMFIADGPRGFAIEDDQKIIRDTAPANTIDETILSKLQFMNGLNTSYGAGYSIWFKGVDAWSGDPMWIPPSIKAMGIYIYTDAFWNPWDAPAGMNRGRVDSVVDCTFSPNQQQAGKIYNSCWNYACNYPIDGIIFEGQKTFQRLRTAFDRVNVRRLFLHLEKEVSRIAKYFVYEGNTQWQRQRFVDAIRPLFENAKQRNGIIEYFIKCDEDNNTPQTIDNNELRCSIAIKPVKTIEFILLNFICTNQSASVSEEVLH